MMADVPIIRAAAATLDNVAACAGVHCVIAQTGADPVLVAGHAGQDGVIRVDTVAVAVDIAGLNQVAIVIAVNIAIAEGQSRTVRVHPGIVA